MEKSWDGYLNALGKAKPPSNNIDIGIFPTTEGNTVSTGFVEWKAKQQKRYDAMSGSWEGVQASEAGASEYMPLNNK